MKENIPLPKGVRLTPLLICLLFLAWMIPGLVGRDPWKADEAYSFGLVLNMVQTGDYVVPTLGSDPFMEKPPVFFITSALFAKAFSPPLALHEAARLSCVFYILLTLAAVSLGGRELATVNDTRDRPLCAVLLLMGSVGLIHTAHMLMTDISLLAGYSIGLYGILLGLRKPWIGGAICGTGAGLALLSKGLLGPGTLGVTVLCLPLFRRWRTRAYWKLLGGIFLAVIPWVTIWPLALYHRSPALFKEWFWDNNLGRFLGTSTIAGGKPSPRLFYFKSLLVFGLPSWPLAIFGLWKSWRSNGGNQAAIEGRGSRVEGHGEGTAPAVRDEMPQASAAACSTIPSETNIRITALAAVLLLAVLSSSWQKRSLYATPILVPLALLGAGGLCALSDRVARALGVLVISVFSVAAVVLWFGWQAQFTGWPALVLARIRPMVPDFVPAFHALPFLVALLATIAWILLIASRGRDGPSLALHWTCGATLVYLLAMTLWLPVANGNMSYRKDFAGLREALGDNAGVIGSRGLGEPQRALIHYYTGIKPLREETRGKLDCRWMLIQGHDHNGERPEPPGPEWRLVWSGRHHLELFYLYRRGNRNNE